MTEEGNKLTGYFENYLKQEPLFVDKKVLQSNYSPGTILHREEQIQKVAAIMAPALRGEKPSNMFIYGKAGTGKTLTVRHVSENMLQIAEKNKLSVNIFYLNCKLKRVSDTEYRLIAELARALNTEIPATGLPTDEVYKMFLNALEREKILMIIILDEIDQLVSKSGDQILYSLTRINTELKNSQISIVGISNDLMFTNYLDPRVKSSLSEEELVFPPYNAIQLQGILKERAEKAFRKDAIDEGVLGKCAAYAAREHGDARRALELLRVAGELAERNGLTKINLDSLDEAEEKIEKDRVHEIITSQPKQSQVALLAIFQTVKAAGTRPIFTGDIYELYKDLCNKTKIRPLTQRRISDLIAELDMLGIINAKVISKGRYGRTRQIGLGIPLSSVPELEGILKEALTL
jgi:cell division control protein 6